MPTSLLFDDSSTARLAGLDPVLSQLPDSLPPAATGPTWELHDVRWTPGESCRLAYRVRTSTSSRFVAVNITGRGSTQHDYREDPMLPGLTSASDPTAVGPLLAELFDVPVRRLKVEPVRYRPGSRCVLRYDLETADGTRRLYAKAFRPDRFAEVARLGGSLAGAADGLRLVPELVAIWPGLHVTVGAGIHGRTVSAVLGDPAVPAGRRARLAHRLGDLLARFHEQQVAGAPRRSATEQLAKLTVETAAARAVDAHLVDRLDAVLDLLAARIPAAGVEVLGHGGFRAGQVLVTDDGRLVVLDTDGVCVCDPARDLGTVLAHLTWQAVRLPAQRPVLRGAEHALLSGYERRAGAVEPEALLWWRAVGLLQVVARRYRRLEIQHWSDVPALVDAAADTLATQSRSTPGGATDLLDIRQMSKVLQTVLARSADSSQSVEIISASRLATAPGRRVVVRYSVRGLEGVRAVPLIGKALTESRRARLLHEHLRLLHDGPFGSGDLRVPEPVALLPAQRVVLYRHCEGTPLDRITEPADLEAGVRRAARWLARLHTSDVVLPRTFSLAQEGESTRQWATAVGQVHPALAAPARALAEGWVTVAMSADLVQEVPIHKDFHPGHVLVGDDLCVIDLDEARQGDPAFDVAHFCCYLELAGGYGASRSHTAAFLDEYAVATGWTDKGTYAPFCAYTWLKIAKQWALGSGPCRDTETARPAAEVERALAKGAECLSR